MKFLNISDIKTANVEISTKCNAANARIILEQDQLVCILRKTADKQLQVETY